MSDASSLAAPFKETRVLITGGLGFIGSTLAVKLASAGASVTVVDSLDPNYGGNEFNVESVREKLNIHVADIRDARTLRSLIEGQTHIFNLAAQIGHVASMQEPLVDCDINARAQLALLEMCRETNPTVRIVYASTRQIYGAPQYLPVDERHRVEPVDVNGVTKYAAEQFHLLYWRVYGIPSTVLRLTNTYGPRMRVRDARQTFLGVWIRAVLEQRPFDVWGGSQLRDLTFVDDAVDAFLLAGSSPAATGEVFNVGGGEVFALRDVASALIEANGAGSFKVSDLPEERRRIDIGDFYSDAGRIGDSLGWFPKVPLHEGLLRTLTYYREHLARYV